MPHLPTVSLGLLALLFVAGLAWFAIVAAGQLDAGFSAGRYETDGRHRCPIAVVQTRWSQTLQDEC